MCATVCVNSRYLPLTTVQQIAGEEEEEEIGAIEEWAGAIDVMVVETEEATGMTEGDTGEIEGTEWETGVVPMEGIGGTVVTGGTGAGTEVLDSNSREGKGKGRVKEVKIVSDMRCLSYCIVVCCVNYYIYRHADSSLSRVVPVQGMVMAIRTVEVEVAGGGRMTIRCRVRVRVSGMNMRYEEHWLFHYAAHLYFPQCLPYLCECATTLVPAFEYITTEPCTIYTLDSTD